MPSAFLTLERALVATLAATPAVSANIQTHEAHVLAAQDADGVVVNVSTTQPNDLDLADNISMWATDVAIVLRRNGPAAKSAAEALDYLLLAVATRIAADESLGGKANYCSLKRIEFDTAVGNELPAHECTLSYQVLHTINPNTLV